MFFPILKAISFYYLIRYGNKETLFQKLNFSLHNRFYKMYSSKKQPTPLSVFAFATASAMAFGIFNCHCITIRPNQHHAAFHYHCWYLQKQEPLASLFQYPHTAFEYHCFYLLVDLQIQIDLPLFKTNTLCIVILLTMSLYLWHILWIALHN